MNKSNYLRNTPNYLCEHPVPYFFFRVCFHALFRLQELNEVAAELCEHITLFNVPQANKPSAIVACVPTAMKVCALSGLGFVVLPLVL